MTDPVTRARLDLILRLTDLTSLELTDTPESIAALCARARRPDPSDANIRIRVGGARAAAFARS